MAEVTGLRNNALPYPVYGFPWGVVFPILDNTGSLVTGAAGLDSEVSLNGDTFADCTNEATEIATNSGMYYLLLTSAEMTANVVAVMVKTSTTDAKTTPMVLYPRQLVLLRSNTAQGGSANIITLDASASTINDFYNGCVVVATIDGTDQVRLIDGYDGSSKDCSIDIDFTVNPDSDDTFSIYRPDGVQIQQANTTAMDGTSGAANVAADGLLARNVAGGSSSGRLVKQALYFLRNKWSVAAGTLTVTETDDTTTSWTATVSSDAAAEPIIGNDPS